MCVCGSLRWFKGVGRRAGANQTQVSGYDFEMPTTAIVGALNRAGLIRILGRGCSRRPARGVPRGHDRSCWPTVLWLSASCSEGFNQPTWVRRWV